MGSQIAQATMIKDPMIERVFAADNKVGREEEGEEQDPTEPEGMSEEETLRWARE
jgi:hypothetical protein